MSFRYKTFVILFYVQNSSTSGQATQINFWTIWAMDRTAGQHRVTGEFVASEILWNSSLFCVDPVKSNPPPPPHAPVYLLLKDCCNIGCWKVNRSYQQAHLGTVSQQQVYNTALWAVAKFTVPDWGIKLTPARVVVLAHQATKDGGPVRQPYAGVSYIPYSGTMNLATGVAVIPWPYTWNFFRFCSTALFCSLVRQFTSPFSFTFGGMNWCRKIYIIVKLNQVWQLKDIGTVSQNAKISLENFNL